MDKDRAVEVLKIRSTKELLSSDIPARIAYIGLDGSPVRYPDRLLLGRDNDFSCARRPTRPKVPALRKNPKVALTIDTNEQPPHILLVRGTAMCRGTERALPREI